MVKRHHKPAQAGLLLSVGQTRHPFLTCFFKGVFMKTIISLIAAAAMGLLSVSAHAQAVEKKAASGAAKAEGYVGKGLSKAGLANEGLYGEVGLSLLSYKISDSGISAKPITLRAIAGYDFHPNLAIEAMLGLGLGLRGANGVETYGGA
jgi:hypothetical protein